LIKFDAIETPLPKDICEEPISNEDNSVDDDSVSLTSRTLSKKLSQATRSQQPLQTDTEAIQAALKIAIRDIYGIREPKPEKHEDEDLDTKKKKVKATHPKKSPKTNAMKVPHLLDYIRQKAEQIRLKEQPLREAKAQISVDNIDKGSPLLVVAPVMSSPPKKSKEETLRKEPKDLGQDELAMNPTKSAPPAPPSPPKLSKDLSKVSEELDFESQMRTFEK